MGFDVKHTTMLQENLTNRGATTLLENVFEGKPFMMSFVDTEHIMDQNLGYVDIANATLDTAEKAHVMWAMVGKTDGNTPQRSSRTWNQLPSQPTFADFDAAFSPTAGICNAWFTRTWPLTQVEGNLAKCAFYVNEGAPTTTPAPDPSTRPQAAFMGQIFRLGLSDMFNARIHSESDKFGYHWKNSKPDWRSTQLPNYSWDSETTHTPIFAPGILHQTTSFPGNRLQALSWPYRRFWSDDQTAQGMNPYLKDHDYYAMQGTAGALDDAVYSSYRPPNFYLKIQPLKGPVGDIELTAMVIVEYSLTLEFHMQHCGTIASIYAQVPGNYGDAGKYNQYLLRSTNSQMDGKSYTGGNNSFWSGDQYGDAYVQTAADRKRNPPPVTVIFQDQNGKRKSDECVDDDRPDAPQQPVRKSIQH